MKNPIEQIVGLRVKDIMNRDVVTVAETDGMEEAARRIFEADVSGVPVVNSRGECVGVLSAKDFVGRDAGRHNLELLKSNHGEPYHIECLNDHVVSTHMSPLVQTISDEALILNAARVMCAEGIHRLVVTDEKKHPVGIISTLDLVASMITAFEE